MIVLKLQMSEMKGGLDHTKAINYSLVYLWEFCEIATKVITNVSCPEEFNFVAQAPLFMVKTPVSIHFVFYSVYYI